MRSFFLYCSDTDDVDGDYGDYYDDVHEPMMYSFRWIVIVMVRTPGIVKGNNPLSLVWFK